MYANFRRLVEHCEKFSMPVEIIHQPENEAEEWDIKVYPDGWDGGHYYAAYETLEKAARKILDEMEVF